MTASDFYALSPELSLVGLALLVVLLDLVTERKRLLAAVAVVGLAVPLGFTIALWGESREAFAGTLILDNFALFFKFLFVGVVALVILSSVEYVKQFSRFRGEYYALLLFSTVGLMLMATGGELITIYIGLELSALSVAALVCFLKDAKSSEGALKYLLLSAVSSAVLLYGMALIFGLSGTTNLEGIANSIGRLLRDAPLWSNTGLLVGIVLLVAGFGFKIASVPFHMWVPDVYEGAPTPITAYLSVGSKAAGFAVILRVFYTAFGGTLALNADWGIVFAVLAAITMFVGNVLAIAQTNIKRMLGYSSIAHAGYLLVGVAALSELGRSGVLFFLASYALANMGAFIVVIAISAKTGTDLIADFSGMARRAPLLAFVLGLSLVSLTGIPPAAGFIAKVYIFNAAVQHGLLWLVIVGVVNSAISAYYYLRVVKIMYIGEAASEEAVPSGVPMRAALIVSTLGVLLLGVYPHLVLPLAQSAVAMFTP